MTDAQTIANRFMEALNERDFAAMTGLLDDDVTLDTLTGQRTVGLEPLRMNVMSYFRHFDETFGDMVLMNDAFGQRVAVDTVARGAYRESLTGLPVANGQTYSIPCLFVFEIESRSIVRLSHYRNIRVFEKLLQR